ncbi:MAG: L,D-transpeptidase, partial [Leptospiraceae bacterium]|nr:L,D-transpeptidase [Leptospiraceae bacterium]
VGIGGDTEGGLKPKRLEMDGRTPEGIYRIFRFYSLDADKKSESYTELDRLNGYYLTAKLGYGLIGKPGKDAGKNVFGPRFYGIDYPAASDVAIYLEALEKGQIPADKKANFAKIGSGIAIHGTNDEASVGKTFGSGCIRLRNEEIVKLDPFMSPGMPVVIFP